MLQYQSLNLKKTVFSEKIENLRKNIYFKRENNDSHKLCSQAYMEFRIYQKLSIYWIKKLQIVQNFSIPHLTQN